VKQSNRRFLALMAIPLLMLAFGCSKRDTAGLEVARAPIDPLVFEDDLLGASDDATGDVYFQAFSGTHIYALTLDSLQVQAGTRSLKVTVPPDGFSQGAYAGGVLTAVSGRDFADYNALTFYARSSVNSTLNVAGFGNDNTGTSRYEAGRSNIPLTTDWTFVVIPIPNASRLISERGLFTLAEGWEAAHPEGHELWFDEIRFANLGNITDPWPVMPSALKQSFIGATVSLSGTYTRYSIDGAFVIVDHSPDYFDYEISDPAVAEIVDGEITIVGVGNSTVAATLNGEPAGGSVLLTGYQPPAAAAPTPTVAAGDVISLFSDAYQDIPVDEWNPNWGAPTQLAEYDVDGDTTKMYSGLTFSGISFTSNMVDVTSMTHVHLDVFAPVGTNFKVKLVAFSAAGALLQEVELTFDDTTTPAFAAEAWSSLEIPLADFGFTAPLDNVGQLIISTSDARLVLVDNIYWHR
jgi:hypothetical protein